MIFGIETIIDCQNAGPKTRRVPSDEFQRHRRYRKLYKELKSSLSVSKSRHSLKDFAKRLFIPSLFSCHFFLPPFLSFLPPSPLFEIPRGTVIDAIFADDEGINFAILSGYTSTRVHTVFERNIFCPGIAQSYRRKNVGQKKPQEGVPRN